MKTKLPNIILLVMDTVRAANCSSWGYERNTTKFLDDLAQDSLIFNRAVSPSSWTLPAHMSLFSGLYPSEHGVLTGENNLPKNIKLLAEILKSHGYHTAGFSNNPWASSIKGLDRGFDVFEEIFQGKRAGDKTWMKKNLDRLTRIAFIQDNGANETNYKINQWMNQLPDSEHREPVFLFVNYMDAHQVYNPRRPYHKLFNGGGLNSYLEMIQNRNIARSKAKIFAGNWELEAEDYQIMINMYDRAIAYLDSKIEEMVTRIDQQFPEEETLLIITSDHGDNFGEHTLADVGLIGHLFSLHQTLIHIPLLIRYPDVFPAGTRSNNLVQLHDIFPTIMEIVGEAPDINNQGWIFSLFGNNERSFVVSEYKTPEIQLNRFRDDNHRHHFNEFNVFLQSIAQDDHKLIENDIYQNELYDLMLDPMESENIIGKNQAMNLRLQKELEKWRSEIQDQENNISQIHQQTENPEIIKRLQDLGYL